MIRDSWPFEVCSEFKYGFSWDEYTRAGYRTILSSWSSERSRRLLAYLKRTMFKVIAYIILVPVRYRLASPPFAYLEARRGETVTKRINVRCSMNFSHVQY